jgi:hypothetical protein
MVNSEINPPPNLRELNAAINLEVKINAVDTNRNISLSSAVMQLLLRPRPSAGAWGKFRTLQLCIQGHIPRLLRALSTMCIEREVH